MIRSCFKVDLLNWSNFGIGLQDPSKFAVAAPVAAADSSAAAAPKEEEKAPEPAEESDEEMGFSLFDD
jgi:large subunit ribosomal protein LP0